MPKEMFVLILICILKKLFLQFIVVEFAPFFLIIIIFFLTWWPADWETYKSQGI